MRNYDRVTARVPEGIQHRKAYIVGGGIAGLAAAAFLVNDAYMPGANITVFEQLRIAGGSMDGVGDPTNGYISRGDRELEPNMECLWYLCSLIPSIDEPGRTVLEETRDSNIAVPINSKYRLTSNQFVKTDYETTGLRLSDTDQEGLLRMIVTAEADLEGKTIEQWFSPSFFTSNLWYLWSSMLAFQPYHSLIEMRRYALRFVQHLPGIPHLRGILHTKYNQYDSIIAPLTSWLQERGVVIRHESEVTDLNISISDGQQEKTVTALRLSAGGQPEVIPVGADDLVLVTNGSMTQNSTNGSMSETAVRNDDTVHRGCFSLWERLAEKSSDFGNPAAFISNPDASFFVSWTLTITDYPQLVNYIVERTGNVPGSGGVITMVDSAWFSSFHVPLQPVFREQPSNVQVLWGYGLRGWESGNLVGKPLSQCNGEEILRELLFHIGLSDKIDEILPHCNLIPTMMPYITSQFMPRQVSDRPLVIPPGSRNLAFIGQFVEVPGDVVFTVETSVRTAMTAVYGLLNLDRPVIPLYQGMYDVRVILAVTKAIIGSDKISLSALPHPNLLKLPGMLWQAGHEINNIPAIVEHEVTY
jgi:oleate hydratase